MADLDRLVEEATSQRGVGQLTDSDLIQELQARGHRVELKSPAGEGRIRIEVRVSETHTSTFAVVSDTHLGSRHQQLTYLHDFYQYAAERGASFVLHSGDMVDGPTQMHLDIIYEQFVHGYDAQVDYAEKAYPDLLPTYAIMGNHDQSFLKNAGGNPVAELARRRPDIIHVGDLGAMVEIEGMTAYLWHPPGGNAYARCLDEQTELLTRRGWLSFKELTNADEIATLTAEHRVEWHRPIERQVYEYQGPMLQIRSRLIDLLVTPDHDLYLAEQSQAKKPREWTRVSARDAAQTWSVPWAKPIGHWRAKRNAAAQVGPTPEWYDVPPLEKRHNKPVKHLGTVPMRAVLRFLGYYVSEGCTSRGRSGHPDGVVMLSQKTHPEISADMAECIRALGLSPYVSDKGVSASSRELGALALTCGRGSENKRVPRWIFDLNAPLLAEFFDAYMAGDGTASGNAATTLSPGLADDLQEIALRLGFSASIKQMKQGWFAVSFNREKNEPRLDLAPEWQHYDGYVWDVTVPNHVFYVRRNGKPCWTGNSYKLQKFIEQYERGTKPHFVFAGHFHTSGHLPNYQNVSAFNVPCFQAQTPFIRRLGLNPDIGGIVIEVGWEEVDGVLLPARHKTDWKIYRRAVENDY